ncbi:hypothetical protein ACFQ1S_31275 [Kibdelosporangium lantanae]|uniref:Uncharacterized protein n=1 Tax=Kibdelosporangium lantanae TaxID=1497396 RepID=A0ABW3MHP3_9PSEU
MLATVMAVSTLGMSVVESAEAGLVVIYLPTIGNDATSGIWVRTPQRARELVRALTRAVNRDTVVSLAGGIYPMTSQPALDAADSGNNKRNAPVDRYETDTPVMDKLAHSRGHRTRPPGRSRGWTVPRCPVAGISPTQITMDELISLNTTAGKTFQVTTG